MKIIGLTGSIAAGKSTVAGWVRDLGIAIHDADAAVHELLGPDGAAVADILAVFGDDIGSVATGIDRQALGNLVFANPARRKQLEEILHPMVRQHRDSFIHRHKAAHAAVIALDVPLLFETGGEAVCDYVIVVHASVKTIIERALSRTGMSAAKLEAILDSQMPIAEKKQRADLLLDTDLHPEATRQDLIRWLSAIGVPMVGAGKS